MHVVTGVEVSLWESVLSFQHVAARMESKASLAGQSLDHFAVTFHVSIINKFCKVLFKNGFWHDTFILTLWALCGYKRRQSQTLGKVLTSANELCDKMNILSLSLKQILKVICLTTLDMADVVGSITFELKQIHVHYGPQVPTA